MRFNCKIREEDITYGPVDFDPDPILVFAVSGDLYSKGYRRVSNAYCRVARIDREDWLTVLAEQRRCSIAHFYNVDGSGISDQHRDHYVRCHSKDVLTVSPAISRKIPTY
jgi:hypothetical protein